MRTHYAIATLALLCTVSWATPASAQDTNSTQVPAWVLDEAEFQTGLWRTDNSKYQSDEEPFEAYELVWEPALGVGRITGALYGIQEGERMGPFWEYDQFWHPDDEQLIVLQFGGDGTVGRGHLERISESENSIDFTYYQLDGSLYKTSHRVKLLTDAQRTLSFEIAADGKIKPGRDYLWERQSP